MGSADGDIFSKTPVTVPDDLLCPVLHTLFRDPVVNLVGNTYERCALERIKARSSKHGGTSGAYADPLTNEIIHGDTLIPNWDMRRRVQAFLDANSQYIPDGWEDRSVPPPIDKTRSSTDSDQEEQPTSLHRLLFSVAMLSLGCAVVGLQSISGERACGGAQCSATVTSFSGEAIDIAFANGVRSHIWLNFTAAWDTMPYRHPYARTYVVLCASVLRIGSSLTEDVGLRRRSWTTAVVLNMIANGASVMLTFIILHTISPSLVANPFLTIGVAFVSFAATWQRANEDTGYDNSRTANCLTMLCLGRIGAHLVMLGFVSWVLPLFAARTSTLAGTLLIGMANAASASRTESSNLADALTVTFLGCTGCVFVGFGVFPTLVQNPSALCGSAMLIVGATLHDLDRRNSAWLSLGGVIMLSAANISNILCRFGM